MLFKLFEKPSLFNELTIPLITNVDGPELDANQVCRALDVAQRIEFEDNAEAVLPAFVQRMLANDKHQVTDYVLRAHSSKKISFPHFEELSDIVS